MIIFITTYLIGFIITFLFLSYINNRFKTFKEYDEPKTYVNYDDHNSSQSFIVGTSFLWMVMIHAYLFYLFIKFLTKTSSEI